MPKYALFGCRVKNGSKELEGGWADCLNTADTIEELKSGFREEREDRTLITFNEEVGKHEAKLLGYLTRKYFVKTMPDLTGESKNFGFRIDWYQVVNLESGQVEEEWELDEENLDET